MCVFLFSVIIICHSVFLHLTVMYSSTFGKGWVGMSACPLVVLACESLHVCTVCIWRCEHARFCVEVFYALYINFHSFIQTYACLFNVTYKSRHIYKPMHVCWNWRPKADIFTNLCMFVQSDVRKRTYLQTYACLFKVDVQKQTYLHTYACLFKVTNKSRCIY